MRHPRLRLTLRILMLLVALIAVGLSARKLPQHRADSLRRAERHAKQVRFYQNGLRSYESGRAMYDGLTKAQADPTRVRRTGEFLRARVRFHAEMQAKHERAARYPWLTLDPDPFGPY